MGGADILNISLTINVATIQPRKAGQRFSCQSGTQAGGLAITQEGQLVITEYYNHCITIIDINDEKRIRQFGKLGSGQLQFQYPAGMAVLPDGNIVVVDRGNDRLQVLTSEGAFVSSVGSKGSQPLQFNNPWDVAIDRNGKVSSLIGIIIVSRSSILTLPTCVALERRELNQESSTLHMV